MVVVVNHWLSCFWFLITKGDNGWVAQRGLMDLEWSAQYPETFYTTLMMVMGDSIDPATGGEYIMASLIVVVGITMNATVFASIATYASQISSDTAAHKIRMKSVQRSLKSLKLDAPLAGRILSYYEYCWTRHRDFSAQALMDQLPLVFQRRCSFAAHEDKLRCFSPFSQADDRFIASLTTKLRPEVYLPEAYIMVAGQVYNCAYFCARGLCRVTWPAEQRDMVNVLTVDDFFGELCLFVTKKLSYTVRARTYVDCYRLEQRDFKEVMRAHPAGAVHVADHVEHILPSTLAKRVTREIYDYSGLRELLAVFMPDGRWHPPKGLAERIKRLAIDHDDQLRRIRKRNQSQRKSRNPRRVSEEVTSFPGTSPAFQGPSRSQGSTGEASFKDTSGGVDSRIRREFNMLADSQDRLLGGHKRLESKIDQMMKLLGGGGSGLAVQTPGSVLSDVLRSGDTQSPDDVSML